MQYTRNNCFGSKKRSTNLRQVKTSKHECQSITAKINIVIKPIIRCNFISVFVLTCSRLTKGRATFFQAQLFLASFLHLLMLFFKMIFSHTSKRQFVVLHFLHSIEAELLLSEKLWKKNLSAAPPIKLCSQKSH